MPKTANDSKRTWVGAEVSRTGLPNPVGFGERTPLKGTLMADQTTSSIMISAEPAAIMAVIADFGGYPRWARGVKSATVLSTHGDGRAKEVEFVLEAAPIKDQYTLTYTWYGDTQVTWSLVRARMLRSMEGAYSLRLHGTATEVTYQLAVDLSIPMIGMLKRKGERVIIDTALMGLKQQVETVP
jgi:hypothetical protein